MIPQAGLDLIFHFEGLDQPAEWPGGASGITIGIGDDLQFRTADDFRKRYTERLC